VTAGLAFLHAQRPPVMHRDVKPANLLLDGQGCCKLSDLGASRLEDSKLTMSATVGTSIFLAPEQLSLQRYDASCDVWATGCVLACLASDREMPYPDTSERILGCIMRGEVTPVAARESVLHTSVAVCCRVHAAERPSAAELAADLRAGALA